MKRIPTTQISRNGYNGSHRRKRARFTRTLERLEARQLLAAEAVISEIMYSPPSGQDADEWIELQNVGDQPLELAGYRFDDGVDFTFPEITVAPGEYLVVAAATESFAEAYPDVSPVVGNWTGRLSNSAEDITLVDATGSIVAHARYADSGDWSPRRRVINQGVSGWDWDAPHDGGGHTLELVNHRLPEHIGHNWANSQAVGGTPGGPNSAESDDAAPLIWDVSHTPVVPTSDETVTVTARVLDESSDVSVQLLFRESLLQPNGFQSLEMFDDGMHSDGAAGDGLYGAELPGHANHAVVEFYVSASDSQQQQRTSPLPSDDTGGQEANYLFQVDDTDHPTDLPLYRTIMTVSDRQQFEAQNRFSDAESNATFIVTMGGESEFRYNVGVRYRGSGTRNNNPPNNRINVPSDRSWQGVTRININANNPHNQVAGSALLSLAGVNGQDTIPIRMLSNEEDLTRGNYYAHVEVLDGDWADNHWPLDNQGNVYKGRRANEGPPGGLGAGLQYFGEDPSVYVSYTKGSNRRQADYSDVIRLTDVLNNAPDDTFLEQLREVADVDQWMRSLAFLDLVGYDEFGLLVGDAQGDDYAMYRGIADPRFRMIPYDLDSLFTYNGTLLRARNVPALNRVLQQPDVLASYYRHLVELMDGALAPERVRPILQQMLADVERTTRVDAMIRSLERRHENVRRRIPMELTAESTDQLIDGQYRTSSDATGTLDGSAPIIDTRMVTVNGRDATYDFSEGDWSIEQVPLQPGMNLLHVEALNGDGEPVAEQFVPYWRDTGQTTSIDQDIGSDTNWTSENNPYQVSGTITIAPEATLTIQAGTQVEFAPGAQLVVRGRLVVEGSAERPVRLTRLPGSGGAWGGLQFRNSQGENIIRHASLHFAETDNGMIGLQNSSLQTEHTTFANTSLRRIRSINSSLIVRNSDFTTINQPGTPPATDNRSEHIWGRGIPEDGVWLLENNRFGHITGHNDAIDFDAPRLPNPIPIIRNNVFEGGGDDALDMTGDVYVEGNIFRNYIKDEFNLDPGESNTISASTGTFFVIRNLFENVHHASLVKETAFMHFLNNTVVQSEFATLYFDLPGQTSGPGRGAHVEGNIFKQVAQVFDQVRNNTQLTVEYNLVPDLNDAAINGPGNISGPALLDAGNNQAPLPGSAAFGQGRLGSTLGQTIPAGAVVNGEPPAVTSRDMATLNVFGAGIVEYRFRVNEGAWSDPIAVDQPIELTSLADGTYTVQVVGRDMLGRWQEANDAFSSESWQVDSTLRGVRLNKLVADNATLHEIDGAFPDLVELHNVGNTSVDLSGMSLSDDPQDPRRFVFPAGTQIPPHGFLLLSAGEQVDDALSLEFGLSANGESLSLYDSNGDLVDSVDFGFQPIDFVLGVRRDGQWGAVQPTFNAENQDMPQAGLHTVRINEWLADPNVSVNNDFLELYNTAAYPVDVGGLRISDKTIGWPDRHVLSPLSFVAGQGFGRLIADGDPGDGKHHLDFRLSRYVETVGLFDDQQQLIDQVRFGPQEADIAEGLVPDGQTQIRSLFLPSPGLPNPTLVTQDVTLVPITSTWRFDQSGEDLGTDWKEVEFDDDDWESGGGALYVENSNIPAPKTTPLQLGERTYYFRHEFQLGRQTEVLSLDLNTVIDDGAVIYLNGTEVARLGMADGPVNYRTLANRTVGNADLEGPFSVPVDLLVSGKNVLAVEAHQTNDGSSDIVFGLEATATVQQSDPQAEQAGALLKGLRITELMYNPIDGGEFEFVEVQNVSDQELDLTGVRFTDGIDFVFPSMTLPAGEFAVVVSDPTAFRQRYGQNAVIAGQYGQSLSNGGESIGLSLPEPYEVDILNFTYDDAWYPSTDGPGFSIVIDDPHAARPAWRDANAWRPSNFVNGSPGFVDTGLDANILRINEVLAYTDARTDEQIELLNTTGSNLDLGQWYLSDDASNLTKYQIPAGTVLTSEGLISFSASEHFGQSFSLPDSGGTIVLSSPDAVGDLAGFVVSLAYPATRLNESVGRHVTSDGRELLVRQAETSFGAENVGPLISDVVISELVYAPQFGTEFVELHNRTDQPVDLFAAGDPTQTWSIQGSIELSIPQGTTLPAGGYAVLVGIDPQQFRQMHNVPDDAVVMGPYSRELDDLGGEVRLMRPSDFAGTQLLDDHVAYAASAPWPVEAGQGTASLIREPLSAFGNDPESWSPGIAGGTPGQTNRGVDFSPPSIPDGLQPTLQPGPSVTIQWQPSTDEETDVVQYRLIRDGDLIASTTVPEYTDESIQGATTYQYQVHAVNAQGLVSEASDPLSVTILGAEATSRFAQQVFLDFSQTVTQDSAEREGNYQIDGVTVESARLSPDGRSVRLTTSSLDVGRPYDLVINGVQSEDGFQIPPDFTVRFAFREGVPGISVFNRSIRRSNLDSLADIQDVLALPPDDNTIEVDAHVIVPAIHFSDDDGHELQSPLANPSVFPADEPGPDNNHALRATGYLVVREDQAGPWTFGVSLDVDTDVLASETVMPFGTPWRYLDDGSDQQSAWTAIDFDDSDWSVGQGQFGYGDGDEQTVLNYGDDPDNKVVTTYFRSEFQLADLASIERVEGLLIRDDGAAVYINGQEVARQNLADGATYQTLADSESPELFENAPASFDVGLDVLVEGTNTVAVELHQHARDGEDLGFDLSMRALRREQAGNDGARVAIDGAEVIRADAGTASSRRLGTIDLAAGAYPIEVEFFESSGGAELSLFAAPGRFRSVSATDQWQLVGDDSDTGLQLRTDPPTPEPIDWDRIGPGGGGVGRATFTAGLRGGNIPASHSVFLRSDQLVSTTVTPTDPAASLTVRIRDEFRTLATATAASAGEAVELSNLAVPETGRVAIEVASDRPTQVDALLWGNTLVDNASTQPANDSLEAALPIDSSRQSYGSGTRLAVRKSDNDNDQTNYYRFTVDGDQPISVAVLADQQEAASLTLLDSAGQVVAYGVNHRRGATIVDFPAEAGDYIAQVDSDSAPSYGLVATLGMGLDGFLQNRDPDSAVPFSPSGSLVGFLGGAVGSPVEPGSGATVPDRTVLVDGENFRWDINSLGSIDDGTDDAYDGGLRLNRYFGGATREYEQADREIFFGPVDDNSGLTLARKVYVSPTDGLARFLEVVHNPTSAPISTTITIDSNFGSDNETRTIATSSGDNQLDLSDRWLVTDDNSSSGRDPTLLHVFSGVDRPGPSAFRLASDNLSVDYDLTVPPNETRIVMHFAAQNADRDSAIEKATRLEQLPPATLDGLSVEEMQQIVNFEIANRADWFQLVLDEGQSITFGTEDADTLDEVPSLDPRLIILNPDGSERASDDNGAGDGRHAQLAVTVGQPGTYRLGVTASDGVGEYVLSTDQPFGRTAPTVVTTNPPVGSMIAGQFNQVQLNFSTALAVETLQAEDFLINGAPTPELTFVDGDSIVLAIDPALVESSNDVNIEVPAGAVADYGQAMNELISLDYVVDLDPPQIVETSLEDVHQQTQPPGGLTATIVFNEPIRQADLDRQDVVLLDAETGELIQTASFVGFDADTLTMTASFFAVQEGRYRLIVRGGSGAVQDLAGNALDAERQPDGSLGDGIAGGDLEVLATFDTPLTDITPRPTSTRPADAAIGRTTFDGAIDYVDDLDRYVWQTSAGELTRLQVSPLSQLDGQDSLSVEVRDSWARLIHHATYASADEVPHEGLVLPSPTGGEFSLNVFGSRGAAYRVQLIRNALSESTDTNQAAALDLTHVSTRLGTSQWSVIGGSNAVAAPQTLVAGVQPATQSIVLVDPTSGSLAARFPAPGNLQPTHTNIGLTAADGGHSLLYVNLDDDPTTLYRLNSTTGELQATRSLGASGAAGLGYLQGHLYRSDGLQGLQRQTLAGDPPIADWIADQHVTAVAADDAGRLFVALADGRVLEVDHQQPGQIASEWTTNTESIVGLAHMGNTVFAATVDGRLVSFDLDDPTQEANAATLGSGMLYGLAALSRQPVVASGSPPEPVDEQEPNNSVDQAQLLDGSFGLEFNPNVGSATENTSTTIPYVTVRGTGDNTFDYYSFTVAQPETRAIFDIDQTNGTLDAYLRLYDEAGTEIASNDDMTTDAGGAGSDTSLDSFLEFTFDEGGIYVIEVGACCISPVTGGGEYALQVSVNNPVASETEFIAAGSQWTYLDSGESPGLLWTLAADVFDDSDWSVGRAQLGYGDGDERTVVSFGDDPDQKHPTTFFRKSFYVFDPESIEQLTLELLRDDGAAVYLNGQQVAVDRLATPTEQNAFAIGGPVSGADESTFFEFELNPSLLVPGENLLAVEIHQAAADDSDLSFDARLSAGRQFESVPLPSVRDLDWYTLDLSEHVGETVDVMVSGQDGLSMGDASLRLYDAATDQLLANGSNQVQGQQPDDFDLIIPDFVVSGAGQYRLEIEASQPGSYSLVVTTAVIQPELNEQPVSERPLAANRILLGTLAGPSSAAVDPAGDATNIANAYDLTNVEGAWHDDHLALTVEFSEPISVTPGGSDGPFVYFELDIDQDPQTGSESFQNREFVPNQPGGPLGVEYAAQVDTNVDSGFVIDTVNQELVEGLTYEISGRSLTLQVPLDLIGNPRGAVNLGVLTGPQTDVSDAAPNDAFLTVSADNTGADEADTDSATIRLTAGDTILAQAAPVASADGTSRLQGLGLELRNPDGEVVAETSEENGQAVGLIYQAETTGAYEWSITGRGQSQGAYRAVYQYVTSHQVIGRHLFYNHSALDGNDPEVNDQDDAAIDISKSPLTVPQRFDVRNYSTFENGLNGVAIDALGVSAQLSADDFQLRIGQGAPVSDWSAAPDPAAIVVRQGAGLGGSDRIVLTWADHAIENTWLEVTVLANDNTRLAQPDVFYFGHLAGDTGDQVGTATVTTIDAIGTEYHQDLTSLAGDYFPRFDFDRDGTISTADRFIALNAAGNSLDSPFPDIVPLPDPGVPYGDSNLDNRFDSSDLVAALQHGEYEDKLTGNSSWEEGDWDGDGDFTTRDLVLAFQQGFSPTNPAVIGEDQARRLLRLEDSFDQPLSAAIDRVLSDDDWRSSAR